MIKYTMIVEINTSGVELIDLDVEQIEESVREVVRPFPEFIGVKIVSTTFELVELRTKRRGKGNGLH